MPYELRVPGREPVTFETEPEAMDAARRCMSEDPEAEPDVIDLTTGKPCAPGATAAWREEFKRQVGF